MSRKEQFRDPLADIDLQSDRRTSQAKGEIDVHDLDAEGLANLRDEDITNLNPDELDMLEAEVGVTRDTEEATDILPVRALHKDLDQDLEEERQEVMHDTTKDVPDTTETKVRNTSESARAAAKNMPSK
jgi:hypothetical protein